MGKGINYRRLELRWPAKEADHFVDLCGRLEMSLNQALRALAAGAVLGEVTFVHRAAEFYVRPGRKMKVRPHVEDGRGGESPALLEVLLQE